jgi:hypothetical protein
MWLVKGRKGGGVLFALYVVEFVIYSGAEGVQSVECGSSLTCSPVNSGSNDR